MTSITFTPLIITGLIVALLTAIVVVGLWLRHRRKCSNYSENIAYETINWHGEEANATLKMLTTTTRGLSEKEALERLKKYGLNKLPIGQTQSPIIRFLNQFNNILIYVLMAAGIVTGLLGHWVDASVILGVVILNAIIGFIQEGKAEDALLAIKKMLSPNAIVLRDDQQKTIAAETLVLGDIVLLQSGDKVPADLRLFHIKGLQIQESALTGESLAVDKTISAVSPEAMIGDRSCMAYSGTLVTHGQGMGIVIATATQTEIGRISQLVSEIQSVTTPLLRQIEQFSRWLTGIILIAAVMTFIFGVLFRNYTMSDMFLAAVSLAVAAIPEGLPAIMTITLAIGVNRMAKRNAIIRRLPAVETLGSVSVICTDKTGTLTSNEMTVRMIITTDQTYEIAGTGYNPHGNITLSKNDINPAEHSNLMEILRSGLLCNESSLTQKDSEWSVNGDPMEGALLVSALKGGIDIKHEKKQYPHIDIIPFESEHRFMATLHHGHDNASFITVKGAPERIIEMSRLQRHQKGDQPLDKDHWLKQVDIMAKQGYRVLAIAVKPVDQGKKELDFSDVDDNLIMLGLFGLFDPPREEAILAVKACVHAGIRVKMITGDHEATALAIAKQINLINQNEVLNGQALETMSEDDLRQSIGEIDVYARVNPEHKLLLIRLMQEDNFIIAMTGDGVNDAPALKRADVGIAMGHKGTEAAKEAAAMVLADDNFASITYAIEEGRTVYDNIKKSILFILPTNGGETLIILGAILLGFQELPLTPVQILWINMFTTVTLDIALAFEPPEKDVMRRPPRDTQEPIITPYLVWRILFVSLIMMAGTMGLFLWEKAQGHTIEYTRTVAVNTMVAFEIFYLFNARYITASSLSFEGITKNPHALIAIAVLVFCQLAFTYFPPMQSLFGTVAIDIMVWVPILLVASSVFILVEIEKYFRRRIN
ncbi:MAG: cation-transporting P-type ATPase [Emcibacter sp.]|nr:cation-transporting P-type ATPase [Emcibacter sp.]